MAIFIVSFSFSHEEIGEKGEREERREWRGKMRQERDSIDEKYVCVCVCARARAYMCVCVCHMVQSLTTLAGWWHSSEHNGCKHEIKICHMVVVVVRACVRVCAHEEDGFGKMALSTWHRRYVCRFNLHRTGWVKLYISVKSINAKSDSWATLEVLLGNSSRLGSTLACMWKADFCTSFNHLLSRRKEVRYQGRIYQMTWKLKYFPEEWKNTGKYWRF